MSGTFASPPPQLTNTIEKLEINANMVTISQVYAASAKFSVLIA